MRTTGKSGLPDYSISGIFKNGDYLWRSPTPLGREECETSVGQKDAKMVANAR